MKKNEKNIVHYLVLFGSSFENLVKLKIQMSNT